MILMLAGHRGVGKDTFCQLLQYFATQKKKKSSHANDTSTLMMWSKNSPNMMDSSRITHNNRKTKEDADVLSSSLFIFLESVLFPACEEQDTHKTEKEFWKLFPFSKVKRYAFADEMKRLFCLEHQIDPTQLQQDRSLKEQWRNDIIRYAETSKQRYGDDIWAKFVWNKIEADMQRQTEETLYVITDLRFPCELHPPSNCPLVTCYLTRPLSSAYKEHHRLSLSKTLDPTEFCITPDACDVTIRLPDMTDAFFKMLLSISIK